MKEIEDKKSDLIGLLIFLYGSKTSVYNLCFDKFTNQIKLLKKNIKTELLIIISFPLHSFHTFGTYKGFFFSIFFFQLDFQIIKHEKNKSHGGSCNTIIVAAGCIKFFFFLLIYRCIVSKFLFQFKKQLDILFFGF